MSGLLTVYFNCKYFSIYTLELLGCLLGISPFIRPGAIIVSVVCELFASTTTTTTNCLTLRSSHCSQGVCSRSSTIGKLLYLSKYSRLYHKLHLIAALLSVAVVVILRFFSSVTELSADKDLKQIWEDNITGTGYSADGETSSSGSGKEISDSDDELHKMGAFKGKEK